MSNIEQDTLYGWLKRLSVEHSDLRADYEDDPEATIDASNLSDAQKQLLKNGDRTAIEAALAIALNADMIPDLYICG